MSSLHFLNASASFAILSCKALLRAASLFRAWLSLCTQRCMARCEEEEQEAFSLYAAMHGQVRGGGAGGGAGGGGKREEEEERGVP